MQLQAGHGPGAASAPLSLCLFLSLSLCLCLSLHLSLPLYLSFSLSLPLSLSPETGSTGSQRPAEESQTGGSISNMGSGMGEKGKLHQHQEELPASYRAISHSHPYSQSQPTPFCLRDCSLWQWGKFLCLCLIQTSPKSPRNLS